MTAEGNRRRRWVAAGAGAAALVVGATTWLVAVHGDDGNGPHRAPVTIRRPAPSPTVTPSADAPVPCPVTLLRLPAGFSSGGVVAGSPSGRYLVGTVSGPDGFRLVRWDGARVRLIPAGERHQVAGVNDRGLVVGGGPYAWIYQGRGIVRLPVPDGWDDAVATGVNARGDVVGTVETYTRSAAVVWRDVQGAPRATVLTAPFGDAHATGISDTGVVVGTLYKGGTGTAYRWGAGGRGQRLPVPAGHSGFVNGVQGTWAYGGAGPAAGGNTGTGVLWELTSGRSVLVPDGDVGAVGADGAAPVNIPPHRAVLRSPTGVLRPLAPAARRDRVWTTAVSADGTRVAGESSVRPATWDCGKPEH